MTAVKTRKERKGKKAGPEPRTLNPDPSPPDLAHITPALRALAVPIDSVKLDPRNARVHGERNKASIRFSLQNFGQQEPVVVDANGKILAGNGRYVEARALGWKYIAVSQTHLTGPAAIAYAVAANRSGELAAWDAEELTATLEEIGDLDESLRAGLEFTDEDIDKMLADAQAAVNEPASEKSGGAGGGTGAIKDQWKIVIDCDTETEQTAMLERFKTEGLKVRALIS